MSDWTTEIPSEDGWYWIRYRKGNATLSCPCEIYHLNSTVVIRTARGDSFTPQSRNYFGFKSAKFGTKIEQPK
jgi:hypothetical protein